MCCCLVCLTAWCFLGVRHSRRHRGRRSDTQWAARRHCSRPTRSCSARYAPAGHRRWTDGHQVRAWCGQQPTPAATRTATAAALLAAQPASSFSSSGPRTRRGAPCRAHWGVSSTVAKRRPCTRTATRAPGARVSEQSSPRGGCAGRDAIAGPPRLCGGRRWFRAPGDSHGRSSSVPCSGTQPTTGGQAQEHVQQHSVPGRQCHPCLANAGHCQT